MTNRTASKFLDSSAWLAYYFGEQKRARDIIESQVPLSVSILSLYEIERKLSKLEYPSKAIEEFLEFLQQRATPCPLTPLICKAAVALSIKHKLSAMDSLIFSTAHVDGQVFVTGDLDFKGLNGVEFIS